MADTMAGCCMLQQVISLDVYMSRSLFILARKNRFSREDAFHLFGGVEMLESNRGTVYFTVNFTCNCGPYIPGRKVVEMRTVLLASGSGDFRSYREHFELLFSHRPALCSRPRKWPFEYQPRLFESCPRCFYAVMLSLWQASDFE